jgi:Spy/CpxP family protein refolding chaperone
MKKLVLAALLLAPLAAAAQAGAGPGPGPGGGMGPGRGAGPGWRDGDGPGPGERGKRARLALTLGLAEALDLDDAQALKLRDAVDRFHRRREPLHAQLRDAMRVLRQAADGERVEGADVDRALGAVLDLRAQAQAADRELLQAVTRDQPPQKKARAALFLARFQHRMEERLGPQGREARGGRGPSSARGPRR